MREKYSTYRVEKLIGSDQFGNVYRAYDESLDRPAALKVLSPGISQHTDIVEHFRKSIQDLAQLTHPRIPLVYFFGKQDNEFYVAMEWCSGGSLSNELRRTGKLPMKTALNVLFQCIDALSAAWKLGIAHGNLKPNNILIDSNSEIKITDLGLVQISTKERDEETISGAISFMPPEFADHKGIDFRADIYSLGMIFHYMLLNRLPQAPSLESISENDSSKGLLHPAVWHVLGRMTALDPDERYSSYDDLIQDLKRLDVPSKPEPVFSLPKALRQETSPSKQTDSLFDLLAILYREMSTGVMKLTWNTLQKQFLIRGGEIVFFNSTQPEESLSHVITVKKWLKESSSEAFEADPERVIRLVLKEGACTFDELRKAYFKLMKAALLQVFHWPQFRGEFYPADIENGSFVSLRISELLLDASRTLLSTEWIKERMSTDSLIHKTPIFEKLVAPFPLTPEESFLAFRFEGEDMNLNTLTVLTGFPEERVLRMTYLLQKIGALELRSAAVRQVKRARKPAYPPSDEFRQPDPVKQQPPADPVDEKPAVEQQPPALLEKPPQAPSAEPFVASPTQSKEKQAWAQKSAELCFQKAEAEYEDGNYGKAAHHCKEALQHHQDAKYYHLLGASYARHPRFQRDAEEALHKAISLSPSDPDYHAILAMFYSQRGLWLRARTHCLKALDISAGHKAANEVYQKVLENKPGKGDCWCVSALKK